MIVGSFMVCGRRRRVRPPSPQRQQGPRSAATRINARQSHASTCKEHANRFRHPVLARASAWYPNRAARPQPGRRASKACGSKSALYAMIRYGAPSQDMLARSGSNTNMATTKSAIPTSQHLPSDHSPRNPLLRTTHIAITYVSAMIPKTAFISGLPAQRQPWSRLAIVVIVSITHKASQ